MKTVFLVAIVAGIVGAITLLSVADQARNQNRLNP